LRVGNLAVNVLKLFIRAYAFFNCAMSMYDCDSHFAVLRMTVKRVFPKPFSVRVCGKFMGLTKYALKIPTCIKCVATLPCETRGSWHRSDELWPWFGFIAAPRVRRARCGATAKTF